MTTLNLSLLLASWLLVYFIERKNIFYQWFTPVRSRINEFLLGFLLMALLCTISQLLLSLVSKTSWSVSEEIILSQLLSSVLYDLNSVLLEELLFRGVLLYFVIKYLNTKSGVLLSAIAFGIYHWFTQGVLGNFVAMALVFTVTGLMGYVFATAYAKTTSIILPFGLHLGWNLVNHTIFSNGPNGLQLLTPSQVADLSGLYAAVSFCLYIIIPLGVLWLINSRFKSETHIAIP
jgi:membrane protease YdiL (CAAX protease family)